MKDFKAGIEGKFALKKESGIAARSDANLSRAGEHVRK